jgi:hypothetical protein
MFLAMSAMSRDHGDAGDSLDHRITGSPDLVQGAEC